MGAVVVYGPQGCGKTRNAERLRKHFGKRSVIDDWTPGDPLPDDCLALTNHPGAANAIAFDTAMGAAR